MTIVPSSVILCSKQRVLQLRWSSQLLNKDLDTFKAKSNGYCSMVYLIEYQAKKCLAANPPSKHSIYVKKCPNA